ncbi:type II-A CRISPR-associated protein Csn2 [Candidatus Saccharibacteria bacterium]|nr:type II-A CRISPR-associated protein Csn2 [Candidatus Saccharibacteria bacterium]
MRLTHVSIDKQIEWNENNHINELIVESPTFFREIIGEMKFDTSKEAKLNIFDDKKGINPSSDVDVIFNPVELDFNQRKVNATLMKILVKVSISEDFYMSTNKFKTKIIKYLNEIVNSEDFGFEIGADDFSIDQIAKAVNFHIVGDEDDFVELITDYLEVMTELGGIRLFVFVGLRGYLKDEELERFVKNLKDRQVDVLLLENVDRGVVKEISRVVIDRDLCEI